MKVLCWLNLSQPELARSEVLRLLDAKSKDMLDDLFIVETENWQPGMRLAFTRAIYEYWWSGPADKIWDLIDSFNWNKSVTGSFSVSIHHAKGVTNKKIADRIWHLLKTPSVKLKNPDTPIAFFFVDDKIVCGKFLWANNEDFEKRRPHLRDAHHPVSCHPSVARALVNLTGAPVGASILDPFCGTGGLLIEAGLMGLRPHGSDISEQMIERCRKNCDQFKVECNLQLKDATHIYSPEKFVVTELPYGRGSGLRTTKELQDLYLAFLERLNEFLRVRAVITYPHTVAMERLVRKTDLRIVSTYSQYIHKSLTKKIIVLEPKKKE